MKVNSNKSNPTNKDISLALSIDYQVRNQFQIIVKTIYIIHVKLSPSINQSGRQVSEDDSADLQQLKTR